MNCTCAPSTRIIHMEEVNRAKGPAKEKQQERLTNIKEKKDELKAATAS